jgi:hypothetical protein
MSCRLVLVILVAAASTARAQGLAELLGGVAANARFDVPARADVRITRDTATSRAVMLGRGRVLYFEVKEGVRALIHPGKAVVQSGGRAAPAVMGLALPATDLLLEDLAVFTASTLRTPLVSDDSPAGVVVTGAPAYPSAYALLVYTIDRERRAIVRTQYYRGTTSNLVKIRRDGALVQLDGHWRPGEVTVEDLPEGTSTQLHLAWRAAPDVPASLFTPAGLRGPSTLDWPPDS